MAVSKFLPMVAMMLCFTHVALGAYLGTRDEVWTGNKRSLRGVGASSDDEPMHWSRVGVPTTPTREEQPSQVKPRHNNPSSVPFSGKLKVRRKNDNKDFIGYVTSTYTNTAGPWFGVTTNASATLQVSGTWNSNTHTELTGMNAPDNDKPYLGFYTSDHSVLKSGSSAVWPLTGSIHTADNAPPITSGTRDFESTVWTYDHDSHELVAQWVNYNGGKPDTYLMYNPSLHKLFITGDPSHYANDNPGSYRITLTVV